MLARLKTPSAVVLGLMVVVVEVEEQVRIRIESWLVVRETVGSKNISSRQVFCGSGIEKLATYSQAANREIFARF